MQQVKHISDSYMTNLEQLIQRFIMNRNIKVVNMTITFNSITETYHAMIIYEDK